MWSFVSDKGNKQWIWLALDVATREIVGVHVGDRSEEEARQLWNSLPSVYRQWNLSGLNIQNNHIGNEVSCLPSFAAYAS